MDEMVLDDNRPRRMGDNQPPGIFSLLDEALADATEEDINKIFEILANHLCSEEPASLAERENLVALGEIWQFGGAWKGRQYEPVKVIESDDRMQRAEKLVKDITERLKVEEAGRKVAKDNFLHKGRVVDQVFAARKGRLETIKAFLLKLLGDRAKVLEQERRRAAEEARLAAEKADAERRAREIEAAQTANVDTAALQQATEVAQEAHAVARRVATRPPVERASGAPRTVMQTHTWVEIVDIAMVPARYLDIKREEALASLRAGTLIPGLVLRTEEKAIVR